MAYKNSPAEKHYDGTRPTLTSTTSLPTNCVSRPSNTEQTNQVVDTVAAPEIPQQTHSAFHMSDCISQEEKKETSSVNTQTKVKDTKVSSTPANQSVAVSDKTVTNTQQGYKTGTGKSSECLNIINFDKTSDTVDKDKITKMDHYDITPFLRSNMTIGADSNSSSKQENMQHFTPNFTLTGARPKSSINSSNTFPKEVAAGDTTSKTHSEKKIDSAVPADGTMVLTGARPKFSINSSNTFPKEVAAGDTTSKTHSEKKTDFTVPADRAMVLTGARPKSSINSLNTFPKEVVAGDTTSKPHSEKKIDFAVPADGAMVPTGAKPKFSINSSNTFPKEVTASDTTSITHSEKKIDFAAPADETMVLMGARPKSSINSSNTFPKEVAAGDTTSKTHSEKKIDSAVPADGTMVLTGARPKFSINSSNTFPKEVAAGDTTSKTHSEKKTDFTVPADMAMVLTGARPKSSINSSNTFPKEVVAGDTTCKTHSEKKTDFVVPADGAMVLTGARAKSSINSSNTFPKEVAAGDTTCKTHSERNDRKKIDFALPVNGAMVLPAGNFAETRLTSNADKNENPMALAIPTKEQLLNAFGGATGYFKSNSLERGCDDAYHIGNIFLMKNKVLGQGPSSIVFEGRLESVDGMPVAVKRITCKNEYMAAKTRKEMDEIWKKLFREVEVLRGIEQWRHPNIVGYYQSQTALNELYIAFQLCQGDLEDYVNEEFGFWRENISALEINQNMAEGVRFLHTNSIVHRDLKPKNVFLVWQQGRCRAVIGDFGMSKVTDRGVYSLSLSVGSIGYLAPEVWEEASKAVRRNNRERPKIQDKSDIFSLGLLFFFTNTNGNHPFGDELLGGQLQIAAGRQPHFDHTRPEDFTLEVLLRKMFTRNPGSRPTADEVCEQPALWDYDAILKFFCDCSEKVEAMVRDGKSIDKIVPNNILPHGNWMRDLPDNLRQYLKQHRVHGKLLYQGRESSTRYLLRAIRNTAAHNPKLPKEVVDDFGTHPAVFWNKKCPRLLTHLFNNIDYSDFHQTKVNKPSGVFPGNRTNLPNKSASNALVKMNGGQSTGNPKHGPHKAPAAKTRPTSVQRGGAALERIPLPLSWIAMSMDEQLRVVVLRNTSDEYKEIAGRFLSEAKSGLYAHKMEYDLTKLKVSQIEKIQNVSLYQQFSVRKHLIGDEKRDILENAPLTRMLWHGTTPDSIKNIIKHGFNRGYSGKNGTWYGEGVYFAVDASYAARAWITQCMPEENGEGHVFLADVITGQYCRGHYGMRYLPPADPDEPTVLYDSAADNPDDPMEFVIFHDTQAYPSYHITFTSL